MALIVLFALLFWTSQVKAEPKIHCSVPSAVSGHTATLTCHFTENIQQGRREFLVHYYADDGSFIEIIYCHWHIDKNSNKPECKLKPGYESGELDNTTFTLKITAVTEENVGKYQCQQLPSDPTRTETCSFTLKAPDPTSPTTLPTEGEPEDDNTLVVAVVVGLVAFVVVAAVVVVFVCRKRLRARCRSEESGVSFSKTLDGKGAAVREEQSALLDETTATTFDTTPAGQALKVLDETGVVLIAAPEKIEKTKTGQDLLRYCADKGYTQIQLHNLRGWSQYAEDREKKYLILMGEGITNDPNVTERAWSSFLKQVGERQCLVVVTVRSSEKSEESVKAGLFPFLQSVPIVLLPAATTESKEVLPSRSDTAPPSETQPKPGVTGAEAPSGEPSSVSLANSRQSTDRKSDVTQSPNGKPSTKPSTPPRQEGDLNENEVEPEEPSSVNLANSRQSTDRKSDVTQSPNGKPSTKPSTPPRQEGDLKENEVELEDRNVHLVISSVPESKAKGIGAIYEDEENTVKAILREAGLSDSELNEVTEVMRLHKSKKDRAPRLLRFSVERGATKRKILNSSDKIHKVKGANGVNVHIRPFR